MFRDISHRKLGNNRGGDFFNRKRLTFITRCIANTSSYRPTTIHPLAGCAQQNIFVTLPIKQPTGRNTVKRYLVLPVLILLTLSACQTSTQNHKATTSISDNHNADAQANALFESFFDEWLSRSPNMQTWLGIKDDYDKWDDLSEAAFLKNQQSTKAQLKQLRTLDKSALSTQSLLSYDLLEKAFELELEGYQWRHHSYPVNQMFGWHSSVPSVLINQHTVNNLEDAEDYIARIRNVKVLFEQLIEGLETRARKGIIAPKFVFPMVIDDSKNIIKGAPFDGESPSPIFADFQSKVDKLNLDEEVKTRLIKEAEDALTQYLKPAYQSLIAKLNNLESRADTRAGAWKFPNGLDYYDFALKKTTTTDLSAKQIHNLGLAEVERIHNEMRVIMAQVGYQGSLQAFFKYLKEDPKFYYPNTEEGRQQYLNKTQTVFDEIQSRLDELFITKPKSDLMVKRVEAFREKSAGTAFYQSPPPDGSRPGIYYVNLYDMSRMPKYELEALLYHEGLPGHHLQLSIATELKDIPRFRKYGNYTAYIEGWGLYSEWLPKELGLYQDPYSDFGRLSMELWRACRLVTDTGLHAMKWTREQAIQYLLENTPTTDSSAERAINRYIVMPSQATAYKIGMLKFIELRENAKAQLGDKFSIRQYHDTVLRNGPLPLNALEHIVDHWIQSEKAKL